MFVVAFVGGGTEGKGNLNLESRETSFMVGQTERLSMQGDEAVRTT